MIYLFHLPVLPKKVTTITNFKELRAFKEKVLSVVLFLTNMLFDLHTWFWALFLKW